MATYDTQYLADGEVTPVQTELPIYGSGRIGIAFNRTGTTTTLSVSRRGR